MFSGRANRHAAHGGRRRTRSSSRHRADQEAIWSEGHHGQIETHPLQAQLRELYGEEKPDDTDIVQAMKAAKLKHFTSVKDQRRPDDI
jgi:hypothetical protein